MTKLVCVLLAASFIVFFKYLVLSFREGIFQKVFLSLKLHFMFLSYWMPLLALCEGHHLTADDFLQ
jgi:hypothetical protein